MSALLELAERCEQAAGGDYDLDCAIADMVGFGRAALVNATYVPLEPMPYTASLDAAMTLFPEGYFPMIDCDPRGIEVEVLYLTDETDNGLGACVATGGKTIALSLCAAALRAKAAAQ